MKLSITSPETFCRNLRKKNTIRGKKVECAKLIENFNYCYHVLSVQQIRCFTMSYIIYDINQIFFKRCCKGAVHRMFLFSNIFLLFRYMYFVQMPLLIICCHPILRTAVCTTTNINNTIRESFHWVICHSYIEQVLIVRK